MGALTKEQIVKQSEGALGQWKETWLKHCEKHSKFKMKPLSELAFSGLGKACVCMANGASLERDIETIKKYQDIVDVMVCDKSLKHAIEHGITPKYCMFADAKVSFEDYCEPYKDKLKDTILFANVCGNPKWTHEAEWKDIYFFANADVLGSEKEFMQASNCPNVIPAGSNVSNAMVIMLVQTDNNGPKNFFGYDKILLTGFDYSWKPEGNYYAFDKLAGDKYYWMRHEYILNVDCEMVYSSSNLIFSAKWLHSYVTNSNIPVVQCSQGCMLPLKYNGKLEDHINYKFNTKDSKKMIELDAKRLELSSELEKTIIEQRRIGNAHYKNFIATV